MLFNKQKVKPINNEQESTFGKYIKSNNFQRLLIGAVTFVIAVFVIQSGSGYQRYDIELGDFSGYDIDAPRDIEDLQRNVEEANNAKNSIKPILKQIPSAEIDVINKIDTFFTLIENTRTDVENSLRDRGITEADFDYMKALSNQQLLVLEDLYKDINKQDILLSKEQVNYLLSDISSKKLSQFETLIKKLVGDSLKNEITKSNLSQMKDRLQNLLLKSESNQELSIIGGLITRAVLKPNKEIDEELTESVRQDAYDKVINSNKVIIKRGERIVSKGEKVTKEKYGILKNLEILKNSPFDYSFLIGIILIMLLISVMLVLYMYNFTRKILYDVRELILLCIIILFVLIAGKVLGPYSPLFIPILIAPMLIGILMSIRLAIIANIVLTIALTFIVYGDLNFILVSLISGTVAPFLVGRIQQRSKLLGFGTLIGISGALIVIAIGLFNKYPLLQVFNDAGVIAINGIISTVFTIGILPFFESVFNITTELKLLELANPNQPLIKKLLMEAPGTYHHSLMVGNLAEVACAEIGGNELMARVGSYYHDIGKLKRPNFFMENQLYENPHDKMTPNLSTLVITSHPQDGVDIAKEYKLPQSIKDIIGEHHGTTLVSYFFHKAKKDEKADPIKPRDFRYAGPRPSTNESAIVMLADSVEAAVRAMPDKSEGKIEGLVRKVIKEKLDDGQLNHCSLTLKDLDSVVMSFTKVFTGLYHVREEYPNDAEELVNANEKKRKDEQKEMAVDDENIDGKQTEQDQGD